MTHICVSKLTIIGSDNGLSPDRRQAIIWTSAGILLIGSFGTNFSEILIKIHAFSFTKFHLKMSSGKWRPSCLGLNVLIPVSLPEWPLYHEWILIVFAFIYLCNLKYRNECYHLSYDAGSKFISMLISLCFFIVPSNHSPRVIQLYIDQVNADKRYMVILIYSFITPIYNCYQWYPVWPLNIILLIT